MFLAIGLLVGFGLIDKRDTPSIRLCLKDAARLNMRSPARGI